MSGCVAATVRVRFFPSPLIALESTMRSRTLVPTAVVVFLALVVGAASVSSSEARESDSPSATVNDLSWMSGVWIGSLGPNTLEERWSEPRSGSIAALVRMSSPKATSMIELIVVEQEGNTLVLRLQQWNPGFKPRTEGPQTMRLTEIGERTVTFEAIDDGGLRGLTYARTVDDQFTISLLNSEGGAFKIELAAGP